MQDVSRQIGNPAIAVADQNAATAMGLQPTARLRSGGSDPTTPAARVLWDASALEQDVVISNTIAKNITNYVAAQDTLNSSQKLAVEHGTERALTIIWGPPGTGKTNTLAALLHGLMQEASSQNKPLNILVTGPTYKAVEEVMDRTAKLIAKDSTARGLMYMGYSATRKLGSTPKNLPSHISYTSTYLDDSSADYQKCILELSSYSDVIIIGCSIRQAYKFPNAVKGSFVQPLFDVVIIVCISDRSSLVWGF